MLDKYKEAWNQIVPRDNAAPHILLLRLFDKYDDKIWQSIRQQTPFHKLSYKYDSGLEKVKHTYFYEIFGSGRGTELK